jgi:formamidopyrimidine-DNA glycosylase
MPELPEVEITLQGISPHILGQHIEKVLVRDSRLRWPVPEELGQVLTGSSFQSARRRAKYLLLTSEKGELMVHLGMSGSLRLVGPEELPGKHDHIDLVLSNGKTLRYRDPRRFGSFHWLQKDSGPHPLLANLGPEPLLPEFNGDYLYRVTRHLRSAVKVVLMNSRIVVGVGNIYANESLFRAGIKPTRSARRISKSRYVNLAGSVKQVLTESIKAGGTTLRDFSSGEGQPGYFKQALAVYGRANKACNRCGTALSEVRLGQRTTVYCRTCQT